LKRARKLDEHPQEVEETGDRKSAPSGRAFMTDINRRWKGQMLITLDPEFSTTQLASAFCKQNVLIWLFSFQPLNKRLALKQAFKN